MAGPTRLIQATLNSLTESELAVARSAEPSALGDLDEDELQAGDTVTITYERQGSAREAQLTLGSG